MPDLAPLLDLLRRDVPGIVAVYLFGSYATGDVMPESDLDLAVLALRPLEPVERFDVQERLAATARRGPHRPAERLDRDAVADRLDGPRGPRP